MTRYAIFGTGGFAREVLNYLPDLGGVQDSEPTEATVFVDDNQHIVGSQVSGRRVISLTELLSEPHHDRRIVIAIADSQVRHSVARRIGNAAPPSRAFANIVSKESIIQTRLDEDSGTIICPYCMITDNVEIGQQFHCNIYSYVAHDCRIGNYVTFAPRVSCNGNVLIEDNVYVGTGAVIRNGTAGRLLTIGANAFIGMGAVVTKSVAANSKVFGNPAKPIGRNRAEEK